MLRNDRINNKGGGVALLIKNGIPMVVVKVNNLKLLEICIIKIPINENENLFIISAYASSDLHSRHEHWNDQKRNFRGTQLYDWLSKNNITYKCEIKKTNNPTFPQSNAFIDIAISDSRLKFTYDALTCSPRTTIAIT
ncbi:hypothetical protein TSAR_001766 [Trichomalopsis sarcophagae]|uniref:Endonuclease/exonuclease/phosphatase domain-containing protein n=1 Tax=Trichomalopsis sarcophagae TaxID=543379 RepID=A0A232EK52_9HYME|nr:hypothetical protein TSAR_001766 [Trichomalopsis sarcophagae]